jgi:glycosyltransferase involved in cell wall biosynthesis
MKLLFLNAVGTVGGAERVLLNVLESLRLGGWDAEAHLVAAAEGPLVGLAGRLGARVTVLPMPAAVSRLGDSALRGGRWSARVAMAGSALRTAGLAWRYARRLRRLVAEVRPDVIHSNSIKCHLLTRLAGLRARLVVWHLHDFLGSRPLMSRGLRWAARSASGAIAVSRAVGDDARAVLGGVPVVVVPNAIDTDTYAPGPGDGARLDRLAGLPPPGTPPVRVGLVATYARWKGQDLFLAAAARVVRELPAGSVRFYVVGGPIYQTAGSQWSAEELRGLAAGLPPGCVGMIGFQEDTASVYRGLDVVVHASTQPEAYGLTIAEAMACARAVIVTRAGGSAELFEHDHDAVGVPVGDVGALAAAIRELVRDRGRRERLAANARHTAVERFPLGRLGPQVMAAYECFRAASPAPAEPV